jgi:hypothetical protein
MLQGKPIIVAPVVAAAQQAFCSELRAYTGAPGDVGCDQRNFSKRAVPTSTPICSAVLAWRPTRSGPALKAARQRLILSDMCS